MSLSNNFPAVRPTLLLDFAAARRLDPRITFVRATTATYYDGVTKALAEQNYLLYSQEFNQGGNWLPVALTVTANTTVAPDGTTTADTLTAQAGSNRHYLNAAGSAVVTVGTTITLSVFARAGTNSFMQIYSENSLADRYANFNLTLGTVTATGASATSSITAVGSGWYRCTVTYTTISTANGNMAIDIIPDGTFARGGTWTAVGTETVVVWGAQYEQRSTMTAYTPTTTAFVSNYIPVLVTASAGTARFDFNPVTEVSLGLLIEEARTNQLLYSADFSNAAWTKAASSITSNTIVAPDGTISGDKLVENATTNFHYVVPALAITVSAGVSITVSVFAKQGERTGVGIFPYSSAAGARFNLADGTVFGTDAGVTATITAVGNGWYRCSATIVAPATLATPWILTLLSGSTNYTGDGYSGIYIWGAQLEVGSFSTSYIATTNGSQPRNADSATMTGTNFSSWYSNSQGTLFGQASSSTNTSTSGNPVAVASLGTTTNNRIQIRFVSSVTAFAPRLVASGVSILSTGGGITTQNVQYKMAVAYQSGNTVAYGTGALLESNASLFTLADVTSMDIGSGNTSDPLNGRIQKIAYYDVRLPDAQLQALTQS